MKIIKLPIETHIKCDDCGTEFEFEARDVEIQRTRTFNDSILLGLIINCPLCDKEYNFIDKIKKEII